MKVYVIGLDALCSKLVKRFVNEGLMPNMKKLIKKGAYSDCLPHIPAQTPENWTTIATGSFPGTHGIATWGRHLPGDKVTEIHPNEAMSSNLCKAEYIWEALSRQGKKTLLLHFPGFPPTCKDVYFIEWLWGPHSFYFEISDSKLYTEKEISFKKCEGKMLKGSFSVEEGLDFQCYLTSKKNKFDTLILFQKGRKIAEIKKGEWSKWLKGKFKLRGKTLTGAFRCKLINSDPENFKLYRTQIFPVDEFTYPKKIGNQLVKKFGPFIYCGVEPLWLNNEIDDRTFIEETRYMQNWVSRAVKYLMEKYNCSLFMMHWHFPDSLQHKYLGLIDPQGGEYSPEKAHLAWEKMKLGYKMVDEFIGAFLKVISEKDYLCIVSDHGNASNKKVHPLLKVLADENLVVLDKNKNPVWEKSKVFVSMTNIYVNLKSRYKGGVVKDADYENIRNRVINILRNLKDQESGENVVALALKREDAAVLNLWGESVGDIVYVYSPGYIWGHYSYFEGTKKVGGANHGAQIPTAETEVSSNYGVFTMYGPEIKKGYIRDREFMGPVMTSDLVPTICYLLNVLPPGHSQGRIIFDFFKGWKCFPVERKRKLLDFDKEIEVIGDVTEVQIEEKRSSKNQ